MLADIVKQLIRHVEAMPPVTDLAFRAEYRLEGTISTSRTNAVESLFYNGNLYAYSSSRSGKRSGSARNTIRGREVFESVKKLAKKLVAKQPYSGRFDLGSDNLRDMIEINFTGPKKNIPAELAEVERIFGGPTDREYDTS